eukprot:TRINITY_DN126_c0_g1_i1.p3 TRINITY_DN126_c0_g1~~TRINITY_DN126_c0_g1_i1.p3  ORF type:complete len:149 (+),score=21.46 TRINITY_DN126_c0_g1_i1:118-564(+)
MIFQTIVALFLVSLCFSSSDQDDYNSCSCQLSYKDVLNNKYCAVVADEDYCDDGYDCLCTFKLWQGCEATCGISADEEDEGDYVFEDIEAESNCTCYFDWRKFWKGCQQETDLCNEEYPICKCAAYHQGSFCAGSCVANEVDVLIQEQ